MRDGQRWVQFPIESRGVNTMLCLCLLAALVLLAGVDGKCEDRAAGERWSTGPPDECARYKCNHDGTMSAVNCAAYLAPKEAGCKLREVPPGSKYPECCPHYDC